MANKVKFGLYYPAPSDPARLARSQMEGMQDSVITALEGISRVRVVRNTVVGAATPTGGPTGDGRYLVCPAVTIPAEPFGADVNYLVEIQATGRATVGPGGGFDMQLLIDAVSVETSGIGHTGSSNANLTVPVSGAYLVTSPGVSHTVAGYIRALSNITILNDRTMNFIVKLTPAAAL